MQLRPKNQRLFASLFIVGAGILLSRTIIMIAQGYLKVFVAWIALLLLIEFLLNLAWLYAAVQWWISKKVRKARLPIQLASVAIIIHAFRVLIYVLGRIGNNLNFDIKPEYRTTLFANSAMGWLYFAVIMSTIGLLAVITYWTIQLRK